MNIIIFEDEKFDNLYPLTYFRPVFELRCGALSLRERIEKLFAKADTYYFMRDYLAPVFKNKYRPDKINNVHALKNNDLLLINGRLLALNINLHYDGHEEICINNNQIVYLKIKKETTKKITFKDLNDFFSQIKTKLPQKEVSATLIHYPWNLIQHNSRTLIEDYNSLTEPGIHGEVSAQATIIGDKNLIHVAETSAVQPLVILDTANGPIFIDEHAIIHPMTHIEGPCYIGAHSEIFGGNIRSGCSIGPVCLVHGEIEKTIFQGYANKHHDGYLGHAYLGEWVNLGAFTTNSDLKNDYTTVKVFVKGEQIDSEDIKVGCFIGDHTKTAINTIINTGAMIGVMSNLVSTGKLIPKFVPSFCWYLNEKVTKGYGLAHTIETAAKAMQRRNIILTPEEIQMFKTVFEQTKEERRFWTGKSYRRSL